MTRNPHASALRNYPKRVINDERHAKRNKAERKRDAEREAQLDCDGKRSDKQP